MTAKHTVSMEMDEILAFIEKGIRDGNYDAALRLLVDLRKHTANKAPDDSRVGDAAVKRVASDVAKVMGVSNPEVHIQRHPKRDGKLMCSSCEENEAADGCYLCSECLMAGPTAPYGSTQEPSRDINRKEQ